MKKLLFLSSFLCATLSASATDEVTAIVTGNNLTINLNNRTRYVAFQMDVNLPAGISASEVAKTARLATGENVKIDGVDTATPFQVATNTDGNTLRIVSYNLGNNIIENNKGALLSLELSTTPANPADITVSNIKLVKKSTLEEANLADVIASEPTTLDIVDGNTVYCETAEKTYSTITYTRNISEKQAGKLQALYVPFSMSYEDWASLELDVFRINGFYEYDDDDNGTIDRTALEVLKVKSGALKPNHPYFIKSSTAGAKVITLNDAKAYPAAENSVDCSTVESKYTFTGTISGVTKEFLQSSGAYFMSGGSLAKAGSALGAYRWYMNKESRGGQLQPDFDEIKVFVFGENEADAINLVGAEEEGTTYNVMGQKVVSNYKGITIKNGKKVLK